MTPTLTYWQSRMIFIVYETRWLLTMCLELDEWRARLVAAKRWEAR